MALLPRLLCKLVAGVHQRTSEHTALYIHRDPSDWMDAGGAHLDTSDAHSPHYYAAERGLSGTVRELLRCLRGVWWDLYQIYAAFPCSHPALLSAGGLLCRVVSAKGLLSNESSAAPGSPSPLHWLWQQ